MKKVLIWIGCFLLALIINLLLLPLGLGLGAIPLYLIQMVLARHLCKKLDISTVKKEAYAKGVSIRQHMNSVVPSALINFCEAHKGEQHAIKENIKQFVEEEPIPKRYQTVLLEMYK